MNTVIYFVSIGADGYAYLFINGILSKRFPDAGNSIEDMAYGTTLTAIANFIEHEKMAKIVSLSTINLVSMFICAEFA